MWIFQLITSDLFPGWSASEIADALNRFFMCAAVYGAIVIKAFI